jgi:hypothetical protein
MNRVLDLQTSSADQPDRVWSTWSIIGCASTLSIGAC